MNLALFSQRGSDAIRQAVGPDPSPTCDEPASLLLMIASVVEQSMGGSSGALYSLFLSSAAGPLMTVTTPQGWCDALGAGIQAIMRSAIQPHTITILNFIDYLIGNDRAVLVMPS